MFFLTSLLASSHLGFVLLGIGGWPRAVLAAECESSFIFAGTSRSEPTEGRQDEINQVEARLQREWGPWVRPARLQEFLVSSLTSHRYQASKYERIEAGLAGVQLFRAGTQGFGKKDMLEIPALFELIHLESLDSRAWRKFARGDSGFSTVALGFASTLQSFKRVLLRGSEGERVFELSRLELSAASPAERFELAKKFRARVLELSKEGPILVIALAKHSAQAEIYRDLLGLHIFETFQSPSTGREEAILVLERSGQDSGL